MKTLIDRSASKLLSVSFQAICALLALAGSAYASVNKGANCASCHSSATGVTTVLTGSNTTPAGLSVSPRLDGGSTSSLPSFTAKPGDLITVSLKSTPKGASGDQFAFAVTGKVSLASGANTGVKNAAANKLSFTPAPPSGWTSQSSGSYFTKGPISWTSSSTQTFALTISAATPPDVYSMTYRSSGLDSNGHWTQAQEFLINVVVASPVATTGTASALATDGAVLNGTVNPNGVAANAYFQYGTTSGYGLTTGTQSLVSGSSAVALTGTLTGLSSATTYHYRMVATSTSGTTQGADQTFATRNAPPVVVTGTASAITYQGATLNGTVNPNGIAGTAFFEYGPTTGYGSVTPTQSAGSGSSAAAFNAGIGSLSASATYHYRLVAANASGTTQGLDQSFVTLPPPPIATTDPATGTTYQGSTLNGTVNPNGLASTFYFNYGTTASYGSATANQSAGSGSSAAAFNAAIASLSAATTYHYQIVGVSASGTSLGADRTFTTLNGPPTALTGTASSMNSQGATLNGTVNPGGQASTAYFEYGTTTGYGTTTSNQSAGSGSGAAPFSAGISSLSAATTYHYRLVAANVSGTTQGLDQSFTTLPPAPVVTTGTATGTTAQGATLNGTVNPNGLAATVYFNYGTTTGYGGVTANQNAGSGSVDAPMNAAISGLGASTTYHYQMVGVSASGTTLGADQSFTTLNGPPVVVTGTATGMTDQVATLNGTVNPNGTLTNVFFQYGTTAAYGNSTSNQDAGSGISALPVNAAISGLSVTTTYHYRIVAIAASGTTMGLDKTFATTAVPPSSNADLLSLSLSAGSLAPAFTAGGTTYGASVANSIAKVTVTPTKADVKAVIGVSINGAAYSTVASGKPSGALALNPGSNIIEVKVTAATGTPKIYSLAVNRVQVPVTGGATVNLNVATLAGTVDGHAATFAFQYGLTTAYTGGITPAQAVASGPSPVRLAPSTVLVSATLSGLVPATMYHYRIVAASGLFSDYGLDGTFVTTRAYEAPDVAAQGDTAPFVSGSAKFLSFGNPAINYGDPNNPIATDHWAFQALVSGSGMTKTNNSGIWLFSGSNTALIARTGDPTPEGGVFATLRDPVLNNHDEVAFLGTVSGTGYNAKNNLGIWANTSGTLHLVAQTLGQLPDATGVMGLKAASFLQIVLPDQGPSRTGVVFLANLVNGVGGVVAATNQGVWAEINGQLKSLIRKGDPLAGSTISALSIFGVPRASAGSEGQSRNFNSHGDLSFKATLINGSQHILVLTSGTGLSEVAASGMAAPAIFGAPTKFGVLGNPIINDGGNTAFQAFVSGTAKGAVNYSAILAETGSAGILGIVAMTGTFAPDATGVTGTAGVFATLSDPVINIHDEVAFIGKLKTGGTVTGANSQGIWASVSGTLARVAQAQAPAPDCDAGFLSFTQFALPDQGGVVFVANLAGTGVTGGNKQGIWAVDQNGNLRLVARQGDALKINGAPKIVSTFSLFTSSLGTLGQTRSFNTAGDLIYKVIFTDKTQAIRKVVFP